MISHSSSSILARFPKNIGLGLRPAYLDLLERLGNPQKKLPPTFHIAGTNGKGSTCAFLRAMLEAGGYRVHVYTSPHLVRFHERIRIAGQLIEEAYFTKILARCEALAASGEITVFEALTATALVAFAENSADFTILEVGLGGRLDATNVVDAPLASIITRLSYDHQQHLGKTLTSIAGEKAGIMRPHIPCFSALQPDPEALTALYTAAADKQTPLIVGGKDWRVTPSEEGFHYADSHLTVDLPAPRLIGAHQFLNAGLAIAALSVLPNIRTTEIISKGLLNVEWPARLQKFEQGYLSQFFPKTWELWLDGGHNDSAGEVLAEQAKAWRKQDGGYPRPLLLICGMLTTKNAQEFLSHLTPYINHICTLAIPNEELSFTAENLRDEALRAGIARVETASNLVGALQSFAEIGHASARILICGSLYLAGDVLKQNEGLS